MSTLLLVVLLNYRIANLYKEMKIQHKQLRLDYVIIISAITLMMIGFTFLMISLKPGS